MAKNTEQDNSVHGLSDVDARLISAAGDLLVERGYRGATTREVAQRAGVTEMTLFRHFISKESLMRRGIETNCAGFAEMVPQPTGDLTGDLLALLGQYRLMWETKMEATLELLPEMSRNPVLVQDGMPEGIQRYRERLFAFFSHYQQAGMLREESAEEAAFAFLGPVFIRLIFGKAYGIEYAFDPVNHIQHYLHGRVVVPG